jgi:predicted RNase H-like HicB family nuclease
MTEYLVIYEQGENGEWGAYSPDVPGCVAAGKSKAEVEQLMHEALPDHIALMREVGEPVPEPHHVAGSIAVAA